MVVYKLCLTLIKLVLSAVELFTAFQINRTFVVLGLESVILIYLQSLCFRCFKGFCHFSSLIFQLSNFSPQSRYFIISTLNLNLIQIMKFNHLQICSLQYPTYLPIYFCRPSISITQFSISFCAINQYSDLISYLISSSSLKYD